MTNREYIMLENCYGQHGWKEFYRNRKDILAEFDKILEQTSNRPIQVAHGQGVEAYFRKWIHFGSKRIQNGSFFWKIIVFGSKTDPF